MVTDGHPRPDARICYVRAMRAGVRGPWLMLLLAACGEPQATEEPGDDGGEGGERTPPVFVEPASGRLPIATTRHTDLVLGVADVQDATRLFIDGNPVLDLGPGSVFATLSPESLTLRLRGALLPGEHVLQMRTPDAEEELESAEVTLEVRPDPGPELEVTLGDEVVAGARVVAAFGDGATSCAAALDDSADDGVPRLVVAPLADGGWAWQEARTIRVPGYVREVEDIGLSVAAEILPDAQGRPERLRVAWRVGQPGVRIDLIDAEWDDADLDTVGATAFEPTPDLTGPVEYAELGRPLLLGETLVAELLAATDVEDPRPGDLAILRAQLQGAPAVAGPGSQLSFGAQADLDQIGRAIDVAAAEAGVGRSFAARHDQRLPVLVEIDPDSGQPRLRGGAADQPERSFEFTRGPMVTVAGAFGERTSAGVTPDADGRFRILRQDDPSALPPTDFSLTSEDLAPLETIRGEVVVTLLDGAPVFLVPFGATSPVHAVVMSDEDVRIAVLDDLHCTSLAVPSVAPGGQGEPLPVACASGGGIVSATLTPFDPE